MGTDSRARGSDSLGGAAGVDGHAGANRSDPLRSKLNWVFPLDWRNPKPVKPMTKRQRRDEAGPAPF